MCALYSVDYPFVDQEGKVWAVALAEPLNWEKRRAGIQRAKEQLACRVTELKPPENRRGDFCSYPHGFSFGNGRMVSMQNQQEGSLSKLTSEL